jgi:hypothetical protein
MPSNKKIVLDWIEENSEFVVEKLKGRRQV